MIKYLNCNDKTLPYKIINKNNKNTYFRFRKDHIEVSKSIHVDDVFIINHLKNNFDKFYQKYLKVVRDIPKDTEIILEEKTYHLNINKSKEFKYQIVGNIIEVRTDKTNILDIKKQIYLAHVNKMVERIINDVNFVLSENEITPLPFKFKYYKTRFGSYHKINNEISLNIVLAKANIKDLYYVIMHEYAHTKEFNHSKRFYNVVKTLMPDYKKYDKRLKNLSIWL